MSHINSYEDLEKIIAPRLDKDSLFKYLDENPEAILDKDEFNAYLKAKDEWDEITQQYSKAAPARDVILNRLDELNLADEEDSQIRKKINQACFAFYERRNEAENKMFSLQDSIYDKFEQLGWTQNTLKDERAKFRARFELSDFDKYYVEASSIYDDVLEDAKDWVFDKERSCNHIWRNNRTPSVDEVADELRGYAADGDLGFNWNNEYIDYFKKYIDDDFMPETFSDVAACLAPDDDSFKAQLLKDDYYLTPKKALELHENIDNIIKDKHNSEFLLSDSKIDELKDLQDTLFEVIKTTCDVVYSRTWDFLADNFLENPQDFIDLENLADLNENNENLQTKPKTRRKQ